MNGADSTRGAPAAAVAPSPLRAALEPILASEGLLTLLVLTSDGLPIEMLGYGLRAEKLAAEVAGLARAARRSCRSLSLEEPEGQRVFIGQHLLDIFAVGNYYLAVITRRESSDDLHSQVRELLVPLRQALEGEA